MRQQWFVWCVRFCAVWEGQERGSAWHHTVIAWKVVYNDEFCEFHCKFIVKYIQAIRKEDNNDCYSDDDDDLDKSGETYEDHWRNFLKQWAVF